MQMKCSNKRCGYIMDVSDEEWEGEVTCPMCNALLASVTNTPHSVKDNMQNCIRWYGAEQVFKEIDKVTNPLTRCEHRRIFFNLMGELRLKFREDFAKGEN